MVACMGKDPLRVRAFLNILNQVLREFPKHVESSTDFTQLAVGCTELTSRTRSCSSICRFLGIQAEKALLQAAKCVIIRL